MEANDSTTQGTLNIGSVVKLVTTDDQTHTGKVLAYDYCAQLLFLTEQKDDADTQDMSIFNVSCCKKLDILEDEKSNQPPGPLAKDLFAMLVRQYDADHVVWEGDTIVIVKIAHIHRPYLVVNIVSLGLSKAVKRVGHIIRLVRHFHESYAAKKRRWHKKQQPQKEYFLENLTKGNAVSEYRFVPNSTFTMIVDDNMNNNSNSDEETEKESEKMLKKPSENEDKPDEQIAIIVEAPESAKPEHMTNEEASKTNIVPKRDSSQFQLNEKLSSVENDEKLMDNSNNFKDKSFGAVSIVGTTAGGAKPPTQIVPAVVQPKKQSVVKTAATFGEKKLDTPANKLTPKTTNTVQHVAKSPLTTFGTAEKRLLAPENKLKREATSKFRYVTKIPVAKKLDALDKKPKPTNMYQQVTNNTSTTFRKLQQKLDTADNKLKSLTTNNVQRATKIPVTTFRASHIKLDTTENKLKRDATSMYQQVTNKRLATFRKLQQKLDTADNKFKPEAKNNVQRITKSCAGTFGTSLKKLDTLDNKLKPKANNMYQNVTKNPGGSFSTSLKKLETPKLKPKVTNVTKKLDICDNKLKPKAGNIYRNVTKKVDNNPPKSYILRQQKLAEERAIPKSKPFSTIINRKAAAGEPASKLASNKELIKPKIINATGTEKTAKFKPTLTKVGLASKLDGPPIITDKARKARQFTVKPATFR